MLHHISSYQREDGDINNFRQTIKIPANHNRISLVSCSIPKSYYLIMDGHNTFLLDTVQYTLTPGNYSVKTFTTAINALISPASIAFSEITAKFTLTSTTRSVLSFPPDSQVAGVWGFAPGSVNSIVATKLTSTQVCNFQSVSTIYITSSLVADKVQRFSEILFTLPVSGSSDWSFISFDNPCVIETAKFCSLASAGDNTSLLNLPVHFSLLDEDGYHIDTNGIDWTMTIRTWTHEPLYDLMKRFVAFSATQANLQNKIAGINN